MDIYFRDEEFSNEVTMKYLGTCVVVDLYHLPRNQMRIWVNYERLDVDMKDRFCGKVRLHLNAHYHEYVNCIDKYLDNDGQKCNKKQ